MQSRFYCCVRQTGQEEENAPYLGTHLSASLVHPSSLLLHLLLHSTHERKATLSTSFSRSLARSTSSLFRTGLGELVACSGAWHRMKTGGCVVGEGSDRSKRRASELLARFYSQFRLWSCCWTEVAIQHTHAGAMPAQRSGKYRVRVTRAPRLPWSTPSFPFPDHGQSMNGSNFAGWKSVRSEAPRLDSWPARSFSRLNSTKSDIKLSWGGARKRTTDCEKDANLKKKRQNRKMREDKK